MAGVDKRVKGSTLIEVMIAMVILLLCFSIGMASILQLNRKQNPTVLTKATFVLQSYINTTIETKSFLDEEIEVGDFLIKRTINQNIQREPLVEIRFEVYSKGMGKTMLETTKIVADEK